MAFFTQRFFATGNALLERTLNWLIDMLNRFHSEINARVDSVDSQFSGYVEKSAITAANDFYVGAGNANPVKKTLSETKTILGVTAIEDGSTSLAAIYWPAITQYTGSGASAIDPDTTEYPVILSNHANSPNPSNFFYIHTTFYSNKASNRFQMAYGYAVDSAYYRRRVSGVWSSWVRVPTFTTMADTGPIRYHGGAALTGRQYFAKLEEDFIGAFTSGRGKDIPMAFTALGSGTCVDWNLRDDAHPGMVCIKSTTTNPSGGLLAATGASQFIQPSEEITIIFNQQSVASGKTAYLGRHNGTGSTAPTAGYWAYLTNTTLRGQVDSSSYQTSSTYTISATTWYRLVMTVNSSKNLVKWTLYNMSGTVLWTDTVSRTLTTNAQPLVAVQNISTTGAASDLTLLDYIGYDILRAIAR